MFWQRVEQRLVIQNFWLDSKIERRAEAALIHAVPAMSGAGRSRAANGIKDESTPERGRLNKQSRRGPGSQVPAARTGNAKVAATQFSGEVPKIQSVAVATNGTTAAALVEQARNEAADTEQYV